MEAATCWICFVECVRGLRARALSASGAFHTIVRSCRRRSSALTSSTLVEDLSGFSIICNLMKGYNLACKRRRVSFWSSLHGRCRAQKLRYAARHQRQFEKHGLAVVERHGLIQFLLQCDDSAEEFRFEDQRCARFRLATFHTFFRLRKQGEHLFDFELLDKRIDAVIGDFAVATPNNGQTWRPLHRPKVEIRKNAERLDGFELLPQKFPEMAHQKDDFELLEACVEQLQADEQAETIECSEPDVDTLTTGLLLGEGVRRTRGLDLRVGQFAGTIDIEQPLDARAKDRRRRRHTIRRCAAEPIEAPKGPIDLSAFVSFASHLALSLIHISEPTRQAEISYAVFC